MSRHFTRKCVVEFIAPTAMENYFSQQVMAFHCRKTISVSTSASIAMKYSSRNESFINERNDYSIIRQTIYEMCANVQTYLVAASSSSSSWRRWDKKRHLCISFKINVIRLLLWWTFIRPARDERREQKSGKRGGAVAFSCSTFDCSSTWLRYVLLISPHFSSSNFITILFSCALCSPCCCWKFCDMLSVGGAQIGKSTIIITHIVL